MRTSAGPSLLGRGVSFQALNLRSGKRCSRRVSRGAFGQTLVRRRATIAPVLSGGYCRSFSLSGVGSPGFRRKLGLVQSLMGRNGGIVI